MVMRPTAAAPAASEPEIAANMPQTRTVADPKPPLANWVKASATSRNLRLKTGSHQHVTGQDEERHSGQGEVVDPVEQAFADQ